MSDDALSDTRSRMPVRFLWRTGPDGRFNAVSDEFVEAIGLQADAVIGRTFAEMADEFDLDPNDEISGLLARRDTWSGRSVMWPLAGGLSVPVDLAALPAYSRDRSFEGFRGFGIVRFPDAIVAPEPVKEDDSDIFGDAPISDDELDQADLRRLDEQDDATSDDPFRGEVPALKTEPPRESNVAQEKVIRLAERRQPQPERVLSPVERHAFREIGDRLRGHGESSEPPAAFGKRKSQDRPLTQDEHGIIKAQDGPQWDDVLTRYDASGTEDTSEQVDGTQPDVPDGLGEGPSSAVLDETTDSPRHPDASTSSQPNSISETTAVAHDEAVAVIEADREQDAVADLFDPAESAVEQPEDRAGPPGARLRSGCLRSPRCIRPRGA